MQVNDANYKYNGTLDAIIKIFNEGSKQNVSITPLQRFFNIRKFYKGMLWYTMSYSLFVGIQFSLFEMIFTYLERLRKLNVIEIPKEHHGHVAELNEVNKKYDAKDQSLLNVAIASFTAGAIAGIPTNFFETIAV